MLPILIRRAKKKDLPFITNSWLKSFRDAQWVKGCPNSVYFNAHHQIIDQLLPRSVVLCAVNEDDPDQILGWCAAEVVAVNEEDEEQGRALVVHYMYVKHPFRRLGIARKLLATMQATEQPIVTFFTHKTPVCGKIKVRERGLVYNPYLALLRLPEDWHDPA